MVEQIDFGLIEVTAPSVEPVTLIEAKAHLAVTHTDDDTMITSRIVSARRACESISQRSFITTAWKYTLERWPVCGGARIVLPRPRLISVSGLTYLDTTGTRQTLSSSLYVVSTAREPAVIIPAYGTTWPGAREFLDSIQVSYTAGYGATAASVPDDIKAAVLLMVGHLYAHRGDENQEPPAAVRHLLAPYSVYWGQ